MAVLMMWHISLLICIFIIAENNSFTPGKRRCCEDKTEAFAEQRVLQELTSSGNHQHEIVIKDSTAYEIVVAKDGRKIYVPTILDFEFQSQNTEDLVEDSGNFRNIGKCRSEDFEDFLSDSNAGQRQSVEKSDEIYEEHFEIDTSVYDKSGCKIMPGSCTKVNKKRLELSDKKKQKTKGVANKHLMKQFNEADQNQGNYYAEFEDDLKYLDEDESIDYDSENKLSDTEDVNASNNKANEIEAVNILQVEDVRHWEMLPMEVRRKNDEEDEFDDKYSVSCKKTPDEKKKGKKKKKHKAQPMSLAELSFQF